MREIAKPDADAQTAFGRAIVATIAVSLGAGVAAVALGLPVYWGRTETVEMVLILAPGIPLMALFITSGSVLVGRGRSGSRASLDTISSVFLLAATLVVVEDHLHARGYALAYLISVIASGVIALALARQVVQPKFRGSRHGLAGTLRASLPFGQFDLFAVVYARADSIMLYLIRGSRPVALYGVAFQIATFLFAMPVLLSNALLPEFMSSSDERRQFLARRALDVILTVALPLPLFGALFARPFVVWIAGARFAGAGPPLAILTGAGAIALLNGYLFQMVIFVGAEQRLWRVIGTVTTANLAANAVAVTLWGADGAAAVMILSEVIGLTMYWTLYKTKMPSPLGRRYPLSVVAASLGLLAIWLILKTVFAFGATTGLSIVPAALALGAIYAALLVSITFVARQIARRQSRRVAPRT
jgi:O-antigen/teichoic acid export membrane protein